ncbi:MAG: cell division protein FtsZ, partial [Clostridia bacterium]|nr:cell division protein FtsZ [Clostridia bacterium]
LFINLDFADVTSVMKGAGYAHMGLGSATGKDKAEQAARAAISSPLLESSIKGARGVLISIMVSPDVGLEDVDLASTMIANEAHPDASVIWGVGFDPELEDEMRITIIATGFDKKDDNKNPGKISLEPKREAKAVPAKEEPKTSTPDDDLDDMLSMFKSGARK